MFRGKIWMDDDRTEIRRIYRRGQSSHSTSSSPACYMCNMHWTHAHHMLYFAAHYPLAPYFALHVRRRRRKKRLSERTSRNLCVERIHRRLKKQFYFVRPFRCHWRPSVAATAGHRKNWKIIRVRHLKKSFGGIPNNCNVLFYKSF